MAATRRKGGGCELLLENHGSDFGDSQDDPHDCPGAFSGEPVTQRGAETLEMRWSNQLPCGGLAQHS